MLSSDQEASGVAQIWRIYAHELENHQQQLDLFDERVHLLFRVLRKKTGDAIEILNGRGLRAQSSIAMISSKKATLTITRIQEEKAPMPRVDVYPAMISFEAMSWMVEKLTELGVSTIGFFRADRSKVLLRDNKLEKLQRIAIEAIRQCGQAHLPKIHCYSSLAHAMESADQQKIFFLDEMGTRNFSCLFSMDPHVTFGYVVGPEASLSLEEKKLLKDKQMEGLRLTNSVLRAETASITALAALRAAFYQNAP
ncbi:MAG: RsmE family RNA methyltransferase [Bdellovibrionota bacterium]